MSVSRPIIIIEDDLDDQQILDEAFQELEIKNPLMYFDKCAEVFEYLLNTADKPFLILCDVNLPAMNGMELKKEINKNEILRKKAIPFVFFTTTANSTAVDQAYEMMVQGYFEKGSNMTSLVLKLKIIIDYWKLCKHPNN